MRPTPCLATRAALALALGAVGAAAQASDLNPLLLTQPEFRQLSEDLGAVISFKPLIPAEALGITGFDLGLAVTGTRLQHLDAWKKATSDSSFPATLPVPTLRAHKGLPFGVDIGASFTKVPATNIQVLGGELRWAFIEGGIATPAVAVRASVTSLSGVDDLSARTSSLDLSISKGFAFITPYAGVGMVATKTNPSSPVLKSESFSKSKLFAGVNLNLGLTNIALETDKTGDATSYGIKLGLRF